MGGRNKKSEVPEELRVSESKPIVTKDDVSSWRWGLAITKLRKPQLLAVAGGSGAVQIVSNPCSGDPKIEKKIQVGIDGGAHNYPCSIFESHPKSKKQRTLLITQGDKTHKTRTCKLLSEQTAALWNLTTQAKENPGEHWEIVAHLQHLGGQIHFAKFLEAQVDVAPRALLCSDNDRQNYKNKNNNSGEEDDEEEEEVEVKGGGTLALFENIGGADSDNEEGEEQQEEQKQLLLITAASSSSSSSSSSSGNNKKKKKKKKNRIVWKYEHEGESMYSVDVHEKTNLVLCSGHQAVYLHELETGTLVSRISNEAVARLKKQVDPSFTAQSSSTAWQAIFFPSTADKIAIAYSQYFACVLDISEIVKNRGGEDAVLLQSFDSKGKGRACGVALTSNEALIAVSWNQKSTSVFDARTGKPFREVAGVHTDICFSVMFSPDDSYLFTTGFDSCCYRHLIDLRGIKFKSRRPALLIAERGQGHLAEAMKSTWNLLTITALFLPLKME